MDVLKQKKKKNQVVAVAVSCLFWVGGMQAAPVVLHEGGEGATQSMATYLSVLNKPAQFSLPDDPEARQRIVQELQMRAAAQGGAGAVRVPIRTRTLTPQTVKSQDAYFPNLLTPVFIVGADPFSLNWLKQWREALLKAGAVGWLVQAENAEDLKAVAEAGAGLRFMAMQGDALSQIFGINAYPVLISARAIEQ